VSEVNKNGVIAFITLIGVSILYHFWGDIKPILALFTLVNVSLYLCVGLFLSTLRTFFEGRKLGKKIKDLPTDEEGKAKNTTSSTWYGETKESKKREFVNELKGNVFRWWFMWPISMTNWMLKNIVRETWDFVYYKIKNFYNYVLELGIKSVS
jgi:hypothetical protein